MIGSLYSSVAVVWAKYRSAFVLAIRSLWLHKLRSALSVLGIVIGTAAVIAMMGFGKGSMEDALEDIRRQGTTNVIVRSIKPVDETENKGRSWVAKFGLTWDDYERCGMIDTIVGMVPMRIFPQEIRRRDRTINARIVATTEKYADIHQLDLDLGRFLLDGEDQNDEGDSQRFRNVIVLGSAIAEELFPFEEVLGQAVVLNKEEYVVVGVLKERTPRGSGSGGQSATDSNNDVYMPINTCKVRFGERIIIRQGGSRTGEQVELHQFTLTIADIDQVRSTGEVVRKILESTHSRKDWEVAVPLDRLEEAERARNRFNVLLGAIALISLLVGGIGIMNIMLATVTERTREIGIRRALGAKRRDITMQFIIEAVVQTTIGGLAGTAVGLIILYGVPFLADVLFSYRLPRQLEVLSIFASLGVAIAVGVGFGWYPAFRASRLDPIEALRHN